MRIFLISAALLSSVAIAAPASAQHGHRGHGYNQGPTRSQQVEHQLDQFHDRIRRAQDRRLLSTREENRLLNRVLHLRQLYDGYRRNGLSQREQQDLHGRIQDMRQRLQSELREGRQDRREDRRDDRRYRD